MARKWWWCVGMVSAMAGTLQCGGTSGSDASGGANSAGGNPSGGVNSAGGKASGGATAAGGSANGGAAAGGSNGGSTMYAGERGDAGAGNRGGELNEGGAAGACDSPPEPGGVHEGNLVLDTPADVEAARSYSRISGELTIGGNVTDVHLPNLTSVGSVRSDQMRVVRLSLPNVTRIDDLFWLYLNVDLVEVDLRHLEVVGGRFYIHRNPELINLQLSSLRSVDGSETQLDGQNAITGNLKLPACQLDPVLERFENVYLTGAIKGCSCSRECSLVTVDGC
ncbi:MAG: hypothetical protein ACOY0T_11530 [Myxococcota bacterium]